MKPRRRVLGCLFSILTTLILPPLLLYFTDPWGARRYFDDLNALWYLMQPDSSRVYTPKPGVYAFSNWSAVILPDHSRAVPDTPAAPPCMIAFLGDSVTFGLGVNDTETWINRLALEFPTVRLVNTGVIGYNAAQVAAVQRTTPADGYLYLMINNDADTIVRWQTDVLTRETPFSLVGVYWYIYQTRARHAPPGTIQDYAAFDTALAQLQTLPNVSIVGFEGDGLATRANVPVIPVWTYANSYADGHANAAGNRQIADALTPYLQALITKVCHE